MQNIATALRVARFAEDEDFKSFISTDKELQHEEIEDELPSF